MTVTSIENDAVGTALIEALGNQDVVKSLPGAISVRLRRSLRIAIEAQQRRSVDASEGQMKEARQRAWDDILSNLDVACQLDEEGLYLREIDSVRKKAKTLLG